MHTKEFSDHLSISESSLRRRIKESTSGYKKETAFKTWKL
ncbi:hypothetical protein GQR36_04125 [Enterococcus termitis]